MPWRENPQPYFVWVSEIMLQQTQVDTVIGYFQRFIQAFPTLEALASAELDQVLKLWEGLGYYSRARNLHTAARFVVMELGGVIPSDYVALQKLPGLGPYTAAALASIAFEVPVPVVDGNVLRVFTRFWGIASDIKLPKTRQAIFDRLLPIIQTARPSDFNQAMMELGALVCKPTQPLCESCPLQSECYAYQNGQIVYLPVKTKRDKVPHHAIGVGVIRNPEGKILIAKRRVEQMLGGLWEFPGGKQEDGESIKETVAREILEETQLVVTPLHEMCRVNHAFSHFKITLYVYECAWVSGEPAPKSSQELRWVSLRELDHYAFPTANRKIIQVLHTFF